MEQAGFPNFLNSIEIYKPEEIKDVLKKVRPFFRFAFTNTKTKYFNVPCSFDIETSSFFRSTGNTEQEKTAIMYEWTFGIYGVVIIGRTWEEYTTMISTLSHELDLNENKRLLIYVHNLGYEFQFMRKLFTWKKVFSISARTPIYALTDTGVEYRCSLLLSGYKLEKLGDELRTFKIKKLVGSLDYEKIRHSGTPLTEEETAYCVNDVKIVMAYIAERIDIDGDIARLPLTKTGYVRNYCRNSCFFEPGERHKKSIKRLRYMDIMNGLRLTPDEYRQLKRAFQGGFTHANPFFSGKVVENVTSYDFTSSYPAVMLAEKFPMSSSERVKIESMEELEKNLKLYCCVFDIEIFGLQSVLWQDNYISQSRCWDVKNGVINNGRVVSASHLFTTITEQDFMIIRKFYTWERVRIYNFRRYRKDYLPTDFVKAILKLYQDKTTLKGVDGKEIEYLKSKEMLNSCFGMSVTDIVREEIIYTDHWLTPEETPPVDYEKEIIKYNNNRGRFLFYPWGVWVTAYARRNLFTAILEFGSDYIYSDTDSIKGRNPERHMKYIEEYNKRIREQLQRAMKFHGIPETAIEPETKDGIKKCLGVWDFDGEYSRFKTLGAKRYLVKYSDNPENGKNRGKVNITVSGLNKQVCVPYLMEKAHGDISKVFDLFVDGREYMGKKTTPLYIPPEFTGKMTHTYIDEPRTGTVIDYLGTPGEYRELSGVHLSKSDYTMSISREYSDFLLNVRDTE